VAFAIPGLLGFLWLIVWRKMYFLPQDHPLLSETERQLILADRPQTETTRKSLPRWRDLLKLPQTWESLSPKALPIQCGSLSPIGSRSTCLPKAFQCRAACLRSGCRSSPRTSATFLAWRFGLLDSPWMVAGCGAKSHGSLRRLWRFASYSDNFHREAVLDRPAFRSGHVFLRSVFDHRQRFAHGPFFRRSRRYGQRHERNRRGNRNHHCLCADRPLFRCAPGRRHSFLRSIVIVAGLIPFIGMILVLLLVRNTSATDRGLLKRI